MNDPIRDSLSPLQSLDWNNPQHQQSLEERLMREVPKKRGFLGFFPAYSPAAAAAILLAVGGAFATSAAVVTNWIVTEEPVGDTQKHVVIQDENGNVVLDDVMDNDTGIFVIDGEDIEESTFLQVKEVDEFIATQPSADTDDPNANPPAKKK